MWLPRLRHQIRYLVHGVTPKFSPTNSNRSRLPKFHSLQWHSLAQLRHLSTEAQPIEAQLIETQPSASGNIKRIRRHVNDVRHYLKSTDVPENIRRKILSEKLSSLVEYTADIEAAPIVLPTLNLALLHSHNRGESFTSILPVPSLEALFNNTARYVSSREQVEYPQFMALLAIELLKSPGPIKTEVLLNIIDMGSLLRLGDFKSTLSFLLSYRAASLPPNFASDVLQHLQRTNRLDLNKFEVLAELDLLSDDVVLVDDAVVTHFITYVESLFPDTKPNLHEYKDPERNIYRVSFAANTLIEAAKAATSLVSIQSLLTLLKLQTTLNSIVSSKNDQEIVESILIELKTRCQGSGYSNLKQVLFEQDLFDESLSETILLETASRTDTHREMCIEMAAFIKNDDIKFSPSLRARAHLLHELHMLHTPTVETATAKILEVMSPYVEESEEATKLFSDIAEVLTKLRFLPHTEMYLFLTQEMALQHNLPGMDLYFYKHFIDCGVLIDDSEFALKVFYDSTQNCSSSWAESPDPTMAITLNKLIQALVGDSLDIAHIFPVFRQIRLHLVGSLTAETLNALAVPMLEANCVGDVMEMMKRELPKMNKDSYLRLATENPWAHAHRALFDTLMGYVVSYKGDETAETNWLLYGELHKYFQIPFDSYLPAMKYFCEVNRLNAALVIFRTLRLLNDLHGDKNTNRSPLKEMYIYLLKVFGDNLYEEGVHELHEFMKMDVSLQHQDILLQNCLLNAYTNLQDIGKARDTFLAISSNPKSDGGVNEETIQTIIKAYTYSDFSYVARFWNNLSSYGIFPNHGIFKQYVIAHVYHGLVEEAVELVSSIDDYNLEITDDLLLAMHNYCLEPHKQKEVVKWLIENHKEQWLELKQSGLLKNASGYEPDSLLLLEETKT